MDWEVGGEKDIKDREGEERGSFITFLRRIVVSGGANSVATVNSGCKRAFVKPHRVATPRNAR